MFLWQSYIHYYFCLFLSKATTVCGISCGCDPPGSPPLRCVWGGLRRLLSGPGPVLRLGRQILLQILCLSEKVRLKRPQNRTLYYNQNNHVDPCRTYENTLTLNLFIFGSQSFQTEPPAGCKVRKPNSPVPRLQLQQLVSLCCGAPRPHIKVVSK